MRKKSSTKKKTSDFRRSAWTAVSSAGPIQTAIFVATAALIYFVRAHDYILRPQLYADDGAWLQHGFNLGASSLFIPLNGFLHFSERLFGFLVAQLPLGFAPFLFNITAGLLYVLTAYYLFTARSKLFTNNFERIFILLCVGLIANVEEFFFNFSNSIFLLGVIGLLIMVAEKPKNIVVAVGEKIIFVLACLTLPFAWFFLPVALIQRFKYKQRRDFFLYVALAGSIIQLIVYLTSHVERSAVTVQSLFSRYTLLEIYNQIVVPTLRFTRIDTPLSHFNNDNVYVIGGVALTIVVCLLATAWVLRRSTRTVWYLLFFCGAMTLASIASPTIVSTNPVEAIKYMSITASGDRYFIFGILGLSIVLVKLVYDISVSYARYVVMVIFITLGIISSFEFGSFFIDKKFVDLRPAYTTGVHKLETQPAGSSVRIPINPRAPNAPSHYQWIVELIVKQPD